MSCNMKNTKKKSGEVASPSSNVIKYQLSNDHYIKLGWTKIPKTKLIRKYFLYETKMTKPHINWPKLSTGTKYYSNNTSPFIVYEDNSKKVFYPNGEIAIEVKKSEGKNYDIYMVFESTTSNKIKKNPKCHRMIAAFDTLGNGLILNENNEIRLTFNQIGGICLDKHVALAPFTWTWSKCKVKPILEVVYIEPAATRLEKVLEHNVRSTLKSPASGNIQKTMGSSRRKSSVENASSALPANQKIISKTDKLLPIKIICLKMNNFISLRILDRRNINLQYFSCNRNLRIELGFDVIFNKPLTSFSVNSSWDTRGFLRCQFDNEFICDWINSKQSIFKSLQEYEKGDDK